MAAILNSKLADWLYRLVVLVALGAFYVGALPSKYVTKDDADKTAVKAAAQAEELVARSERLEILRDDANAKALDSAVSERNLKLSAVDDRLRNVERAVVDIADVKTSMAVFATQLGAINSQVREIKDRIPNP